MNGRFKDLFEKKAFNQSSIGFVRYEKKELDEHIDTTLLFKSCTKKRRYEAFGEAFVKALQYEQVVYDCDICNAFHLASCDKQRFERFVKNVNKYTSLIPLVDR